MLRQIGITMSVHLFSIQVSASLQFVWLEGLALESDQNYGPVHDTACNCNIFYNFHFK